MTYKSKTALVAFVLLLLFCTVVFVHEHKVRKSAHAGIETHAAVVANALWNQNPLGAAQYLSLACSSYDYKSIVVMDTRGNIFQKAAGEPPGLMQRFFSNLYLINEVPLSSPIRYNDKVIGTIRAVWYCNTIYFDILLLLVLIMLFMILRLNIKLFKEKQELENHVAYRTKELFDLNENLQNEVEKHQASKAALLESEKRYRSYFEENMAGSYISSPDGRLITCNQEYVRIFGFKNRQEALDTAVADIYQNQHDRERFLADIAEKKRISGYETTFRRMDGKVIHLVENAAAVFDEHGNLDHIRGFLLDVTEKRALEAQLVQTRKMESIGRLAGGVAHDFNNMLNVILGHTELALDAVDPSSKLHHNLKQILKAASRSADITRQLLAFARRQTVAPKALDLNETVGGMLKMLRRLIGEDIELEWEPAKNLWQVKIDPSQVDQILANLCVNARDAIDGIGKITIRTGMKTFHTADCYDDPELVPGDFVLLSISDTGGGMDTEIMDNLFEPFFTTKDVGKGTGLGLSTVYGIVKQNKGAIKVFTERGLGTTFNIYLPRHVGKTGQDPAGAASADIPSGQGQTIMLVEDETAILEMLSTMLRRLDYTLLKASTPLEALGLAQSHAGPVHLLITDVVMPEMNGRDLALRLTEIYPDLRCLFMSGYTANVIAHQGVLDEGVHFLQKPFSMKDIATKVNQVLSQ